MVGITKEGNLVARPNLIDADHLLIVKVGVHVNSVVALAPLNATLTILTTSRTSIWLKELLILLVKTANLL